MERNSLLALGIIVLLAVPAYYLYVLRPGLSSSTPVRVVENYVRASYARNFKQAYRSLSAQDRKAKDEATYVSKQGAFSGFTARLAAKLAGFIEAKPMETIIADSNARIKLKLRVPDPDRLSTYLFGWDEDRLNLLSAERQNAMLAMIDRLQREKKLPFTEAEESFDLIRENNDWRILLQPNKTVRVQILVKLPGGAPLQVEPEPGEVVFQPGEPFNVKLKVRNQSDKEVWARVAHTAEPEIMAKFMGLRDCGAYIPFHLAPHKEKENSATFLVWTDIPAETKHFKMIYEFAVDKQ